MLAKCSHEEGWRNLDKNKKQIKKNAREEKKTGAKRTKSEKKTLLIHGAWTRYQLHTGSKENDYPE